MKARRASTRAEIRKLTTQGLHRGASELAGEERGLVLGLLFYLDEIEKRRDFGDFGSLWDYCINGLGIPEAQVFLRVKATRLIRAYPQAIERLRDGRLNLSTLVALRKALTRANADVLFRQVEGKTRKQAAQIAAMTKERVVAKSSVKPVKPHVVPVPADVAELRRAEQEAAERAAAEQSGPTVPLPEAYLVFGVEDVRDVEPVSATQCQVTFTAPIQFQRDLEEIAPLLSHCVPDGDLSEIVQYAVRKVLQDLRKKRGLPLEETGADTGHAPETPAGAETPSAAPSFAARGPEVPYWEVVATKAGGFKRVHIPEALHRSVWARDGGRCQGTLANGKRCGSRWQCELDHIIPVARGGRNVLENLRVLCRRCNQEAERSLFGDEFVDRRIREKSKRPASEEVARAAPE